MADQAQGNATSVGGEGHVTISAGEAVNFDQIESITAAERGDSGGDAKDAAGVQDDEPNADAKAAGADGAAVEGEETKEEDGAAHQEQEGKVDPKAAAPEKNPDGTPKSATIFKAKVGDKEVDLPSDAKFTAKVNGKPEEVTAQELVNNYSGRAALDRNFQAFKTQKLQFEKQRATLNSTVDRFIELGEAKDYDGLVEYVLELTNGDAEAFHEAQFGKFSEKYEKLQGMTEAEKTSYLKAEQSERKLSRETQRTKKLETKQSMSQLDEQIGALEENHGIDRAEFSKLYKELQGSERVKPGEITIGLVVDYHKELKLVDRLEGVIKKAAPALEGAEADAAFERVRELVLTNPQMTDERLHEIVGQAYGKQATRELAKKVGQVEKLKPQSTGGSPRARQEDPISFDDV